MTRRITFWLLLHLIIIVVLAGCTQSYDSAKHNIYRELRIKGITTLFTERGGGTCWLDLYFEDGTKMWIGDADRRICAMRGVEK